MVLVVDRNECVSEVYPATL